MYKCILMGIQYVYVRTYAHCISTYICACVHIITVCTCMYIMYLCAPLQTSADMDYFARSHEPRYPQPVHMRYRVGQVVQHKIHGYRGIIIGWDPTC